MNQRNDDTGEWYPGAEGSESTPDQYGQEHSGHREYGPSQPSEGPPAQGPLGGQGSGTLRPQQHRRHPMEPKGYQRSDERLREEISERLMQANEIDSSEVTVQVLGGKVILEGTVADRYMMHAIEDLAAAAPGAQDIDNRIKVVGLAGAALQMGKRAARTPD